MTFPTLLPLQDSAEYNLSANFYKCPGPDRSRAKCFISLSSSVSGSSRLSLSAGMKIFLSSSFIKISFITHIPAVHQMAPHQQSRVLSPQHAHIPMPYTQPEILLMNERKCIAFLHHVPLPPPLLSQKAFFQLPYP